MITDLVRDLSHTAQRGSVQVPELCAVPRSCKCIKNDFDGDF
jgi:anthranilate/para-aminobenzoate synthase component I